MCWYWFPINNFCRDSLILVKVCWRMYHFKIQVKFDMRNHPQNFGWVMALFRFSFCWCVDIGFCSITFAGMHRFYWKFAKGYIIIKYWSSSILVIIRKILAKFWPFFDSICVVGMQGKDIVSPNNFWRDALILFEICSEGLPLRIGAIIRTSIFFLFLIKWLAL